MKYYKDQGADPNKLVMGIPMYGQAFSLADPSNNGINAKAPQRGLQGEFTRAAGFLAYYEICQKVKNGGWTVVHHDREAMGPYAFKGNQWVGYDDVAMVRRKSEFVKASGYGGAMIWALDLDDFKNVCGCEPHPLLRTINRVLRSYPVTDPKCDAQTYDSLNLGSTLYDLRGGSQDIFEQAHATANYNPYLGAYHATPLGGQPFFNYQYVRTVPSPLYSYSTFHKK